jgi:hypothetical protein
VRARILKSRSPEVGRFRSVHSNASFTHPFLAISVLNIIAFVPDLGIGVANSLKPLPALEVVKKRSFSICSLDSVVIVWAM